nr:PREDICTED: niban-like protein 1 [Latimeria chalumnae]|eukprot:XP_006006203.1 PREDICTED: niban-like protein 1 [Latimeria chalumnae]
MPKAEQCVRNHVQPYIQSILDALMDPTSRGFSEVRDLFFKEVVEINKNVLNEGGKEKLGEYMEKLSQLAYHPVKMQSCYKKMDQLHLEGLQQRFDVPSAAVFIQRAQILMREQTDDAVYTFEQLLHQSLENSPEKEELSKAMQGIQDRVLKKFDYDSSTVRKKFFREALLQISIPYLLKKVSPTCNSELSRFQEYIFEDFSRYILVENVFEEVVLQSVMKDIMLAVKEAAVQRKHNLFRDSIVMTNSDPNLHLLGEGPSIDWGNEYNSNQTDSTLGNEKRRRMRQVVSFIRDEGPLPYESCLEVPTEEGIQEEPEKEQAETDYGSLSTTTSPKSPDSVDEIRGLLTKVVQVEVPSPNNKPEATFTNGTMLQEVSTDKVQAVEEAASEPQEAFQTQVVQSTRDDSRDQLTEQEEAEEPKVVPTKFSSPEEVQVEATTPSDTGHVTLDKHDSSDRETGEEVLEKRNSEEAEFIQNTTERFQDPLTEF